MVIKNICFFIPNSNLLSGMKKHCERRLAITHWPITSSSGRKTYT